MLGIMIVGEPVTFFCNVVSLCRNHGAASAGEDAVFLLIYHDCCRNCSIGLKGAIENLLLKVALLRVELIIQWLYSFMVMLLLVSLRNFANAFNFLKLRA